MNSKKVAQKNPPDQKARNLILEELDQNLLVEAAAGTGKTTSMVGRMVQLLQTGKCADIKTLAAITFTRKAAAELRGRFQIGLEKAARETKGADKKRLVAALGNIEQCYVGTIHSFCARLLRERPVEAGVDLVFKSLEDDEDIQLRKDSWSEFCAGFLAGNNTAELDLLEDLGLRLNDLENVFVDFANYPDVDEWPIPPQNPDAIKLSDVRRKLKRYIAHMEKLAPDLPSKWATDLIIPLYLQVPRKTSHYDLSKRPDLIAVMSLFINKTMHSRDNVWNGTSRFTAEDGKAEVERYLSFRENVVLPFFELIYEQRYEPIMKIIHQAREVYDTIRATGHHLNFQDLLMSSAALLRDKPHIRRYFAERITHLLVDEFHDTDPIQAETMLLLTATVPKETNWRKCIPRPGSLFVVGDPKQSIYRFRRADIVTYNEVKKIIASHGKVVQLSANFRSCEQIIDWVNQTFEPPYSADLDEEREEGTEDAMLRFNDEDSPHSPAYVPLKVGVPSKAKGQFVGVKQILLPPMSQKDIMVYEPEFIAKYIKQTLDAKLEIPRKPAELKNGVSKTARPGDFLIVAMRTMELSLYANALKKCGIPHSVTGGNALNKLEELRHLHMALRAIVHRDDSALLVAVLRGPLFGVSDQSLYAYKKSGGFFSYIATIPVELEEEHRVPIEDAFEHLNRCASWLNTLPPVTAIDKIAGDLGLYAMTGIREGGDTDAGSLGKALELLRSAQLTTWSIADLIDHLGQLVDEEAKHDAVSSGPAKDSVVRIMNVHKVKGLEAPVVFLASPIGHKDHPPSNYIDRSSDKVIGYLAMSRKKHKWSSEIIAQPAGWDTLAYAESEFLTAEKLRLRYVAATRAGAAMIISIKSKNGGSNPWQCFAPFISEKDDLPDPEEPTKSHVQTAKIHVKDVKNAKKETTKRLETSRQNTYAVERAKSFALSGRSGTKTLNRQETKLDSAKAEVTEKHDDTHGVKWGSVIHSVLEAAMKFPDGSLNSLAAAYLQEYALPESLADTVVSTAKTIIASPLWNRAQNAEQRFVEAPFHILLDEKDGAEVPTIVRGSIDLVFKESDGWVLVDYKTDSVKDSSIKKLTAQYAPQLKIYADAWTKCTGEPVKEMGFLFSQTNEHVIL